MSSRQVLLALLLVLGAGLRVAAQTGNVVLQGREPDYAGVVLTFTQKLDYISDTDQPLTSVTVGSDGQFEARFGIIEPTLITLELGVYSCLLFVEPGQKLRIGLPPRLDQTEAERLNPFFEPVEVRLRPVGEDSLSVNAYISRFDRNFERCVDSVMRAMQRLSSNPPVSIMREAIASFATEDAPAYVVGYKQYRLGLYDYLTGNMRSQQLSDTYFRNRPVLHNNPAYMELFNLVYDRYFVFHGRTEKGKQIYDAISVRRSYTELCQVLAQNDNLGQDTLRELVILKNLHDEFFSSNFSRSALTAILDSLYHQTRIPEHAAIATLIRERVTRLLPGFIPYSFTLEDQAGKLRSLRDFRGKYVLLAFCTTASYTCIQEFALLQRLLETYGEHLEVVCICADDSYDAMTRYVNLSGYKWPFLFYGRHPKIIREYDIRAYPTYFLLDADGRVSLSPAPSPQENLDLLLLKIFRDHGWTPRVPAGAGRGR